MQDSKRDTFLSVRQLLEYSRERCRQALKYLEQSEPGSGLTETSLLDDVIAAQNELLAQLDRFLEDGSEKVLSMRLQYKTHPEEPDSPSSPEDALRYTTAVNEQLVLLLEDQVIKSSAPDSGEQLEDLREAIVSLNRQISMIRITGNDI